MGVSGPEIAQQLRDFDAETLRQINTNLQVLADPSGFTAEDPVTLRDRRASNRRELIDDLLVEFGSDPNNLIPFTQPGRGGQPIRVEVTKLPFERGPDICINVYNDEFQRNENTLTVVQDGLNAGLIRVSDTDAF